MGIEGGYAHGSQSIRQTCVDASGQGSDGGLSRTGHSHRGELIANGWITCPVFVKPIYFVTWQYIHGWLPDKINSMSITTLFVNLLIAAGVTWVSLRVLSYYTADNRTKEQRKQFSNDHRRIGFTFFIAFASLSIYQNAFPGGTGQAASTLFLTVMLAIVLIDLKEHRIYRGLQLWGGAAGILVGGLSQSITQVLLSAALAFVFFLTLFGLGELYRRFRQIQNGLQPFGRGDVVIGSILSFTLAPVMLPTFFVVFIIFAGILAGIALARRKSTRQAIDVVALTPALFAAQVLTLAFELFA